MQQVQTIKQVTQKSEKLIDNLKQKLKFFQSEHEEVLSSDQKKILKLFNYTKWSEFMKWVEQKLADSVDVEQSRLSQIQQEQAEMQESIQQNIDNNNDTMMSEDKSQSELLAMQNAKLRRENITLQTKIQQLSNLYNSSRSIIYHRK